MGILGKIDLQETSSLEFGMEVMGTTEGTSEVRFVIEGPDFDIVCHCKEENGNVTTTIPKLKGILPAGVYEAKLECIISGKIFTPLRESIELNPLVEFDVSKKGLKPTKEGVRVSVKKMVVSEETRESKRDTLINEAIQDGYELTKMKGFDVLKKDKKYFGIVNENAIIMAKVGHTTLSSLVEELSK